MLIGAGSKKYYTGSALLYKPSVGLEYKLKNDLYQTGIGKVISLMES